MAALREEITDRLEAVKTSSQLNKTSFSVLFCLFERPRMAGAAAGDFDFKIAIMMKDLFGIEENEMRNEMENFEGKANRNSIRKNETGGG